MRYALIAAALAVTAPLAAEAAVSVLGSGSARQCFEAAEAKATYRYAILACDEALSSEDLSIVDRAATFVNRGIVNMQSRNLTAAIADYDAAIKLRPETAEAYVNKGIALLHLGGRDAEAVKVLSEGLARNPRQPEVAYYTRGIANEMRGALREAYDDYAKAAELAPNWAEPQIELQRFQLKKAKTANG
jgi:tetratricopeptide (TPR) repeat protein